MQRYSPKQIALLLGAFVVICGVLRWSAASFGSSSAADGNAPAVAAVGGAPEAVATATARPTLTPLPTLTSTPTETPAPSATPTVAPPISSAIKQGDLQNIAGGNGQRIGVLCVGDIVDVISRATLGRDKWYQVRVRQLGRENCGPERIAVGAEGWELGLLTTLTYSFDEYAQTAQLSLPTAVPSTPTIESTVAPRRPTAEPAYVPRVRVGAICRDGSHSNATGRGACSHHGGVAQWLYNR